MGTPKQPCVVACPVWPQVFQTLSSVVGCRRFDFDSTRAGQLMPLHDIVKQTRRSGALWLGCIGLLLESFDRRGGLGSLLLMNS